MKYKEAVALAQSPDFQRQHVSDYDNLIEFCNWARAEMRVDGPVDRIQRGEPGDGVRCPLARTFTKDMTMPVEIEVDGTILGRLEFRKKGYAKRPRKRWEVQALERYADLLAEVERHPEGRDERDIDHPDRPWSYEREIEIRHHSVRMTWIFSEQHFVTTFIQTVDDQSDYSFLADNLPGREYARAVEDMLT